MQQEKIIHKGKSRIWAGSIIAALIAAVSIFVMMMQMEKNMLLQYEKGSILVASREIPKGEMITEENAQLYFEEMEVDKHCIPKTAIVSVAEVSDMVPVADLEKGVLLTYGMFEKMEEITAGMDTPVIAGFKADDLYQVVGGVLRTGDRINIYYVAGEGDVRLIWRDVFVHQVFDNAGNSIANEDKQTAAQRINIYMDQENVEQFYSNMQTGALRVVKVCE